MSQIPAETLTDVPTVDTEEQVLPDAPKVGRKLIRRIVSTPIGVIGVILLSAWILIAIFAPLIAPYDPLSPQFARLTPPNSTNWFGTDSLGRDLFSRVIAAARITLPVSVVLVVASMTLGGVLGAIAGYFGKWVDEVIMRIADLVLAFPTIILAMVIAAALGPGIRNAVIAILLVNWPTFARVARSLVMSARNSEYVVAGRLMGASATTSLARDILPNVISSMITLAMLDIGSAILSLAGLSFLALGAVPPTPDWGSMVSEGVTQFSSWWIALFPGLAILTVVVGCNLVGDVLRDALDPATAETMKEVG